MTKLRDKITVIKVIEIQHPTKKVDGLNFSYEKKRYKTAKAAAAEWAGWKSDDMMHKKWGHYSLWVNDDPYVWERKVREKLYRRALPIFERILA